MRGVPCAGHRSRNWTLRARLIASFLGLLMLVCAGIGVFTDIAAAQLADLPAGPPAQLGRRQLRPVRQRPEPVRRPAARSVTGTYRRAHRSVRSAVCLAVRHRVELPARGRRAEHPGAGADRAPCAGARRAARRRQATHRRRCPASEATGWSPPALDRRPRPGARLPAARRVQHAQPGHPGHHRAER